MPNFRVSAVLKGMIKVLLLGILLATERKYKQKRPYLKSKRVSANALEHSSRTPHFWLSLGSTEKGFQLPVLLRQSSQLITDSSGALHMKSAIIASYFSLDASHSPLCLMLDKLLGLSI